MKKIIQFHIYQGQKYYVAESSDIPVVTQGKSLDELILNIREAVNLALEGEDTSELGLAPSPSVMLNFELDTQMHAPA